MKVIDNRGLLLKLRNPAQVTAAIPRSKLIDKHTVLVKWGIEEARVLRNMNIKNIPSPILGQYEWTGQHAPYNHQKITASFLTMNRRGFCFNEQGCVDSETEYLSPTGWVKISEYSGGKVAQYGPRAGRAEFVDPEEYVKLPCSTMVKIKTKYGIDQLLSPEHRVLLCDGKREGGEKTETLAASALLERHDAYHAGHRVSVGGTKAGTSTIAFAASTIPTTFTMGTPTGVEMPYTLPQLRVLVAVIADGYFESVTKYCVVRLKKDRKKRRLRALLQDVGIIFTEKPCLPEGFAKFTFHSPERWKEFGEEFWKASRPQRQVIADECMHWDGCTTRGARFSSSSKQSADYIQYVFASTGIGTARVSVRTRKHKPKYTVQVRRGTDRVNIRGTAPTMSVTPSTDGFKYCFRVPSTYLLFRRNGCIFASGNTGKTGSAIWASDYLMREGLIRRVLVICPLSIMDSAWRADLFKFAMHRRVDIAYGRRDKRREIISGDADYVIINYDGVEIVRDEIAAGGFDLIIVDEANHYKNAQSKRWKTLASLITPDTWIWMMTGTPAAQSPVDAFGLARIVNPSAVPRFFSAFRDLVMTKITNFKWAPRPGATDLVFNALQPAIRFTKEQCLDLPEMTYVTREVEMTPQQTKYYKLLKKEMMAVSDGESITAVNAAVNMNKLLQIACGAVYTDSGDTIGFDISNRYKVLREVIDESSQKVIIFAPFRHVIDLLRERLTADKITNEVIRGDVSAGKRTEIFARFQDSPELRVLVIQPQAAAHGVTLTAANTIVWWGPTSSLETYAQANARIHRSGQKHPCTVVQLQGSDVERVVYRMLGGRLDVHSKMIDLYREVLDA